MPPPDSPLHHWFVQEVQPHEAALRAFLSGRFPQLREVDDVVQETYARLLREHDAGRVRHVRAFLFTAARNVALDVIRRRRTSGDHLVPQNDPSDVVEETPDAAIQLTHQEELAILADALRQLPERCRQVMLLRYLKGHSYKDIARLLQISPETVKTQITRGTLSCSEHFAGLGLAARTVLPLPTSD